MCTRALTGMCSFCFKGDIVNDTIIGDPLFTATLPDGDEFMCYKVHGQAGNMCVDDPIYGIINTSFFVCSSILEHSSHCSEGGRSGYPAAL